MNLCLGAAAIPRRRQSVRPVRCNVGQGSVFTKSGGVMETRTARMAVMKLTVVCTLMALFT